MNNSKAIVVSFSSTPDFAREVRAAAESVDRTFSSFVRVALREYLASHQPQEAQAA